MRDTRVQGQSLLSHLGKRGLGVPYPTGPPFPSAEGDEDVSGGSHGSLPQALAQPGLRRPGLGGHHSDGASSLRWTLASLGLAGCRWPARL